MSLLILIPLFLIGAIVIISRVAKWVGEGVEAVIGIVVAGCAIFAILVIAKFTIGHVPKPSSPKPAAVSATTTTVDRSTPEQSVTTIPRRPTSGSTPIPSPRETIPDAVPTTTLADPASRPGFGSLWLNVCGSSRRGYYLCKGSKPTAEQVAACFPADACIPADTARSREIPA